jgi:hypothetical protein
MFKDLTEAVFRYIAGRLACIRHSRHMDYFRHLWRYSPMENMLRDAMHFVSRSQVDGDYLEFGVESGDSFISAYHLAKRVDLSSMRFYAFDSFEGLPKIKGIDRDFQQFHEGDHACTIDDFKENLHERGVDLGQVKIIPGWYSETLTEKRKEKLGIESAAIVLVDCDLYNSTVPILDFVKSLLVDGTILIFDDWYLYKGKPDRGEQRAFREWLKRNSEIEIIQFQKYGWHGNSFIIQKPTIT